MKIGLQLQQKQSLIMTQRLQQALKLLQVPTLELQQILQQELQQNPLLEGLQLGGRLDPQLLSQPRSQILVSP